MSHVRMCDGRDCGKVFPEAAEGATTGTMTRMVRNPVTGRREPDTISADYCPECSGWKSPPPALAIVDGSVDTPVDRKAA